MEKETNSPSSHSGDVYFSLQASWGFTKHLGGLRATRLLAQRCHIGEDKKVLVVGCGVGTTACYLVKEYRCRVVGTDISESMIERSRQRARREGVADMVDFRVADAQALPFEDGMFDAVICESVLAFVGDRQKAVNEFTRVTRSGGYVGFNEVTWLKPPPLKLVAYLTRIMGADFLMADGWKGLLEQSGLGEISAESFRTNVLRQWSEEVSQFETADFMRAWGRYAAGLLKDPAVRKFTVDALSFPKSIFSLFSYFGYGIYSGMKG